MRTDVVGFDLGTTYSAIAVPGEGTVDLVPVDGERICPSVVGFDPEAGFVVGRPAFNRAVYDPVGTVRSVKRAMGTDRVFRLGGEDLAPEAISARILGRLLDAVERAHGKRPSRAVISVPAYFGQEARQATRRAGELAGLEVLRLVHEPTAAALVHRPEGGSRQVLVYDLGGGTFDASLVRQDGALLEVVASHGDTRLGGDDFDLRLAEMALAIHAGGDPGAAERIRRDPVAWARLLLEAEAAKRRLSTEVETVLRIEFLESGGHLEVPVTREAYEAQIDDLLGRTIDSMRQVLDDARMASADLDEILLVGGSTRTPAVWHSIHEVFGMEPSRAVHPDEAVALGAGIEAGMMAGIETGRVLVDVSPYSLGVAVLELDRDPPYRSCRTVMPKNSAIPSRHVEKFTAVRPDQEEAHVFVFQGPDEDPTKNRCVGFVRIEGLGRRSTDYVPEVQVALEYNLDGIVDVRVVDGVGSARAASRFRSDGASSAELMARYLEDCERSGTLPGPDGWPDATPPAAVVPEDPAAAERAADLATILERLPELKERYPVRAGELEEAERRARAALEGQGGAAELEAAYDSLSDVLFELGEFVS